MQRRDENDVATRPAPLAPEGIRPRPRRRRLAALAFVATLAVGLGAGFHRLLLGAVIISRDTSRLHFPLKSFIVAELRRGRLPLWYPFESLGTPCLAAGVTAVFHPLTWLAVAVGPLWGHALATLASIVLMALGVWLLSRALGASRSGAAVAVLLAIGGGSFVSILDNQTFLWGAVACPFLLLGSLWAARRPRAVPGVVLVGVAVAWALLAGDFEAVYLQGLLGLALGLMLRKGSRRRAALRIAAGGALGAGLGGIQLLPSLALLPRIDRAHGLPWQVAARWSMHPLRLPELFLGDLVRYWPHGAGPKPYELITGGGRGPWQLTVYLGGVALLGLLLLLPTDRRRRVGLAVAGLGLACVWLALGRYGGAYWIAYHLLPGWNAFRYPEKVLPVTQVLIAVAAGVGVTAGHRHPRRAARIMAAAGIGAVVLVPALGVASTRAGEPLATWLARGAWGAGGLGLAAGALALVWHLAGRRPGRRLRVLPGFVAVALACLELAPVDGRLLGIMTGPTAALEAPSVVASAIRRAGVRGPGVARVTTFAEGNPGLAVSTLDPEVARGYLGRVLWNRDALLPDNGGLFGLENTTHYLPATTPRYRHAVDADPWGWILRGAATFNGRFDVFDARTFAAHHLPRGAVILDREDLGIVLVENAGALPRAFVTTPRFVAGGPAAAAALSDPAVQHGQEAVVEGAPPPHQGLLPPRPAPGPATVVTYAPRAVTITTAVERPGVLVLDDAFSPGWTATVDGRPAPVRRANYLVRGVLLAPGHHRVVFRYPTPPSVWAGAALSAAALLGLLAVAGGSRRRWRRR